MEDPQVRKALEHGFPGVILGIQRAGNKPLIKAGGFANLESKVPMKPDDRFHIASVTKIFTATAALMLIDDGKLSLDSKVSKILDPKLVGEIPNIEQNHYRPIARSFERNLWFQQ